METLPTRKEYLDGSVTFEEFYSSVAKEARINFDNSPDLERVVAALKAGDKHLNSIPLAYWDRKAAVAAPRIASALKLHGDFYSLAGGVCVMKQAAINAAKKEL